MEIPSIVERNAVGFNQPLTEKKGRALLKHGHHMIPTLTETG
jgi:hypothetical protein